MSRRRLLGCAILALWLGVVGWHVQREYFQPQGVRLASGARALAPGSYYYRVGMDGRPLGFASSAIDTSATGFVASDRMVLFVPALDTTHRAVVRTRVELDRALGLRGFRFRLESELGRFSVHGRMRGDSALALEIDAGGRTSERTIRFAEPPVLAAALPLRLAAGGQLEVGSTIQVRLFDPSTLAARDVTVRVTDRDTLVVPDSARFDAERGEWVPARYDTVPAWKIEQRYGGVRLASWVGPDGRLLRAESPLGFKLERTAYQIARQAWRRAERATGEGYGRIIGSTAIASSGS